VAVKKFIATANVKRKTPVWEQLQNRLIIVEFEMPTAEELREIVKRGRMCQRSSSAMWS